MNFESPASVFQLANLLALPGWAWLLVWLFLPKNSRERSRYVGLFLPLVLSLFYAAAALVHITTAAGGFDTLSGVSSLFENAGATLAGWIHFLAFDLLVGWAISQHALTTKMNRLLIVPCLLMTFIFGPIGFLLYAGLLLAHYLTPGHKWRAQPSDSLLKQIAGGNVILARCGVFLSLTMPILLLAYAMDVRELLDVNGWLKPIKFALALVVYTFTLSWFSTYLSTPWRDSRRFNVFTGLVVCAIVLEMLWIISAASIGEASHFNQSHPILKPVYFFMGVLATLLTAQSLVIGIGLLRHRQSALKSLTRYSLAYGLITTFVLTMITAGYMAGGPAQSHAVIPDGVTTYSEKEALFFMGWLRNVGDLRVSHFFATHALHAIPFIGWVLANLMERRLSNAQSLQTVEPASWQKRLAIILCVIYSAFVLALFLQALMGRPLL